MNSGHAVLFKLSHRHSPTTASFWFCFSGEPGWRCWPPWRPGGRPSSRRWKRRDDCSKNFASKKVRWRELSFSLNQAFLCCLGTNWPLERWSIMLRLLFSSNFIFVTELSSFCDFLSFEQFQLSTVKLNSEHTFSEFWAYPWSYDVVEQLWNVPLHSSDFTSRSFLHSLQGHRFTLTRMASVQFHVMSFF